MAFEAKERERGLQSQPVSDYLAICELSLAASPMQSFARNCALAKEEE